MVRQERAIMPAHALRIDMNLATHAETRFTRGPTAGLRHRQPIKRGVAPSSDGGWRRAIFWPWYGRLQGASLSRCSGLRRANRPAAQRRGCDSARDPLALCTAFWRERVALEAVRRIAQRGGEHLQWTWGYKLCRTTYSTRASQVHHRSSASTLEFCDKRGTRAKRKTEGYPDAISRAPAAPHHTPHCFDHDSRFSSTLQFVALLS